MSINHIPQRERCDCQLVRCFASHWALYMELESTQISFFAVPKAYSNHSNCIDFRLVWVCVFCILCSVRFIVSSAGPQSNCRTGHDMRLWSVEQQTGKSDYAVMWHHVSYLWVPEGAYTGNASLGYQICQRWDEIYIFSHLCQLRPMLWVWPVVKGRSFTLKFVPSRDDVVQKL